MARLRSTEARDLVQAATAILLEREERAVLARRYGLQGHRACVDLDVIALDLGVSGFTARRLLHTAETKLRACEVLARAYERTRPVSRPVSEGEKRP